MRKRDWCFAAAALAVGVGWTGFYTYRHPESVMAQCVLKSCDLVNQANPVVALARSAAHTLRSEDKVVCNRNGVADQTEECLPEEPTPSEPAPVVAEPKQVVGVLTMHQAAHVPAPIVIQEEQVVQVGQGDNEAPMIPAEQQTPPASQMGEASDDSHVCPRVMPYCPGEACNQTMPYVPADTDRTANPLQTAVESFQKMVEESQERQTGYSEEAEPTEQKSAENEAPAAPKTSEPSPGSSMGSGSCQDSHHYHHRYSVCPYSGKCVDLTEETATPTPEPIPAPVVVEEQEPKEKVSGKEKRKSKKTKVRSRKPVNREGARTYPGVDTMEFRPSDQNLNEYSAGPY